MSTPLIVGQPLRVRVWTDDGSGNQAAVNTLFYVVAAVGATPATDQNVADNIDTAIYAHYKSLLNTTATYRGVQCQILNTIPPYLAYYSQVFTIAHAGIGTGGAGTMARQCCGLISYQTNRAGRRFRGRSYISFPSPGSDSGSGRPSAAYLTSLAALSLDFSSGYNIVSGGATATLVRVILHRKDKFGVTADPTPILAVSTIARWATQRRRGEFGRQNKSPI